MSCNQNTIWAENQKENFDDAIVRHDYPKARWYLETLKENGYDTAYLQQELDLAMFVPDEDDARTYRSDYDLAHS